MKKVLAVILLATSSPQLFADDSGCERIAHGASIAVGAAAAFSAGPAGSGGAAALRALGGWAAYELTDRTATQLVCDNSTRIELAMYDYGLLMLCSNGHRTACDLTGLLLTSFARDFAICGGCTMQEVIGAYLMEDNARKAYFEQLRKERGRSPSYLPVISRNHLQPDPQMLAAYYQGVSEGLQKSLLESFGSF
jgi:hypothetical protein